MTLDSFAEQSLWESGAFIGIVIASVVVLLLILCLMVGLIVLRIKGQKMSKVHKLNGK